jgi:hypothetical protein
MLIITRLTPFGAGKFATFFAGVEKQADLGYKGGFI